MDGKELKYDQIERYLNGQMTPEELNAFNLKLEDDSHLQRGA